MIKVNSIALTPVDFPANAAVKSLNGCITNKYKAVVNFSFQKYTSNQKRLQFSSVAGLNTIININNIDNESFISTYNFLPGETIIVPSSVHNSGTLTITAVSDRFITVSNTLTDEILEVGYIYVNKKITSLDFYYNLLANSDTISFLSKTDKGTFQKYTVSGIDPAVTSPSNLTIGTKSFAWVTDIVTGIASTSTIKGVSFTGYTSIGGAYVQTFEITHYFYEAPFFLKEQSSNFTSLIPPSDFNDTQMNGQIINNGWQYAFQINTKYATGNIYQDSVISSGINGSAAWFDQNNARTIPEFSLNSIAYAKASDSSPMSSIDIGMDVNVTMKIKSASGLFVNSGGGITPTSLILNYFYCPNDESSYQNTATTLLQNFMFDKCVTTLGGGSSNGINYGGNYQVLKSVTAVYVDASNATVTFTVSYSTFLKNILKSKSAIDRNYSISICAESTID